MRSERFALIILVGALACAETAGPADGSGAVTAGGGTRPSVQSCTGALAGGTYENVEVPRGSSCSLAGVTVKGNVVALEDAELSIDDSRIGGNVQGDKADVVQIRGTTVGGSIQIADGISEGETGVSITAGTVLTQGSIQVTKMRTGRIVISDVILEKGNLKVEENAVSQSLDITNNDVAQNLEVLKHVTSAPKAVSNNTVGQKLECKENEAPFVEAGNTARDFECSVAP